MDGARPVRLELPSEPSILAVVRESLRALVESDPGVRLDEAALGEVQVALQEACTNSIRHAHAHDVSRRLIVQFTRHVGALELVVEDDGDAYELSDHVPDPEDLQEGGYGTSIMRAWMDEVRLERRGDRNVLTLLRRYERGAADLPEVGHA